MKKKIFGGIAVIAIVVVVAFNVSLSTEKNNQDMKLSLANVEALAQEATMNSIWDWPNYGARADEKTKETKCNGTTTTTTTSSTPQVSVGANVTVPVNGVPVGVNVSASTGSSSTTTVQQTNIPSGVKKTCESGGNTNCDPCDCC